MKKYYNFETLFISLRDEMRAYLKKHNIYYELSACCPGYHFEILATEQQANAINKFIDSISITEVRA